MFKPTVEKKPVDPEEEIKQLEAELDQNLLEEKNANHNLNETTVKSVAFIKSMDRQVERKDERLKDLKDRTAVQAGASTTCSIS